MMKQFLLSLTMLVALAATTQATAQAVAAAAPATAAAVKPDAVLMETTEHMRDMIRQNHTAYEADKGKFYGVVDEVLVPRFDVRYIAQLTLGKNWRTASEAQRTRFQAAFKNSLIRTYADALLANYDSVDAKYEPLRMAADATDVTVRVSLMRKKGEPVGLAFAMREVDNDWKIYDVIIENLSLVTNFRSQFSAEIKKNGLDALINKMESGSYFKQNPPKAS